MRILVDVDNTLCDNMGEWLRIYNEAADDNVKPEDIVTWDIESYLKPEWIPYFWEVAYPRSFQKSKPFPHARMAIVELMVAGHEIAYVTAGVCVGKMEWLFDWEFSEGKVALAPKNVIIAYDKSLIIGDILVDDGLHNVAGRRSILFDQPWNRQDCSAPRAHNWRDVEDIILGVFP